MKLAQLRAYEPADYSAEYALTEAAPPPQPEVLLLARRARRSPLDGFRDLSDGIPPSNSVIGSAERVLGHAVIVGLIPDRTVAIPDGGLAIYFFGRDLTNKGAHRLVARLALDNDGAITLLLEDVEAQTSTLTDEEIEDDDLLDAVLARIKSHVSG